MARKTKASGKRAHAAPADSQLAQNVAASAQKIWLAGLGAFARAKTEGDKVFEMLVERGKSLRGQAREAADEALQTVRSQVDATAGEAKGKWDKLEQVFEERVARSLNRLGVLTNKDMDVLARQVAQLNASVQSMMGGRAKAKPASRAKAPARKPSARKPAAAKSRKAAK